MIVTKLNFMKYISFFGIIILLGINVTGCNEETAPTEYSSSTIQKDVNNIDDALHKGNGPSVNGQAILPRELLFGYFQNFSFHAREDEDGSIRGSIEFKCRIPGSGRAHGIIDCMNIEGNQATLSGKITQTDTNLDFLPENTPFWFRVVDNGEGNYGSVDEFSDIWVLRENITCSESLPWPFDMSPLEQGNVQVNP